MKKIKNIFGEINLTWPKVIIFAILTGIYTAIMAILKITRDTSFADISISFEWWILFGIIIITNSKSSIDSALKCFVFFLISQPLVYLIQVPFNEDGFGIFRYYPPWFLWTILTLPMGYFGYYMKKDKWWGLLILTPMLLFLGYHFQGFLSEAISFFPNHLISAIFCAVTIVIYPLCIFKNKKVKLTGVIISILIIITMLAICFSYGRSYYNTTILVNGGESNTEFDDSYKVYLKDEKFGKVYIVYEKNIDDYMVNAEFSKTGQTELILESPNGEKTIFDINIKRNTYDINKKESINLKDDNIEERNNEMIIEVNNKKLIIKLEENVATKELLKKLEQDNIAIDAREYGNFEKVGNIGFSLPSDDKNIKVNGLDVVLYDGDKISILYNSNTWSYTKIGKITNVSKEELKNILGNKDVKLILKKGE